MWADTVRHYGRTPYGTMGRHHRALPTFTTFINYFFPAFTTFISYFYQLSQLLLAASVPLLYYCPTPISTVPLLLSHYYCPTPISTVPLLLVLSHSYYCPTPISTVPLLLVLSHSYCLTPILLSHSYCPTSISTVPLLLSHSY